MGTFQHSTIKDKQGEWRPLSSRAYLLSAATNTVTQNSKLVAYNGRKESLAQIAAVHYLYGADITGIFAGDIEKAPKHLMATLNHRLEPTVRMYATRRALLRYKNEGALVTKYLAAHGYHFYYPYLTWPTENGKRVQQAVNRILKKNPHTRAFKEWEKKSKAFAAKIARWFRTFKRKHPSTPLLLNFLPYGQVSISIRATLPRKSRLKMTKRAKGDIHERYILAFNEYANFLVDGFLARNKSFPKTEFER